MNQYFWRRTGRLWIEGGILLVLRLWQNRVGFDGATGLAKPSLPGTALPVLMLLFAALELVQTLPIPDAKGAFTDQFAPPDKSLPAAVAGCLLLAAGGAVLLLGSLTAGGTVTAITGLLGAAAAAGLLLLLREARAGETASVLPVLPAMFFGVFLVLSVYLPTESDPVLARRFLPVLATALTAYAFSQLGGFLRADGSPRAFLFTADLAVPACLAAIADGGLGLRLLYAGCALTLSVFLFLRREAPAPAPFRRQGRRERRRDVPPRTEGNKE